MEKQLPAKRRYTENLYRLLLLGGGGGVDPIPCVSTHRISDPRSGPAQLLPPHVKQRSHPHGVRSQLLLGRLINRQVEVFYGFGRHNP